MLGFSKKQAANIRKAWNQQTEKHSFLVKLPCTFLKLFAHGSDDFLLGWVIMVSVEYDDEHFMFAPDVQGPMSNQTLELILKEEPTVIMLGGPPFYLGGFRVEMAQLDQALKNLGRIVEAVPLVILEHHALRDEFWKQKVNSVFEKAFKANCSRNDSCRILRLRKLLFLRIQLGNNSTETFHQLLSLNNG